LKALNAKEAIYKILREMNQEDLVTQDTRVDNVLRAINENKDVRGQTVERQLFGLLFASVDTTTTAINGIIWHLINNPDVIEKCKEEVRKYPYPETVSDFHKYTYLNKVIHESMRVSLPSFVGRECKEGIQYKNYYFPPKTKFMIFTGYSHLDVKDYNKFDPDRTDNYKWEPFGTPARNCLGKIFAQVQIKLFLIKLLKEHDLLPELDKDAKNMPGFGFKNARLKIVNSK